jgi:hypothetical protein
MILAQRTHTSRSDQDGARGAADNRLGEEDASEIAWLMREK